MATEDRLSDKSKKPDWWRIHGAGILLTCFRRPHTLHEIEKIADWKLILRCEPEVVVERWIEGGMLELAEPEEPVAQRLQRLTAPELQALCKHRDLPHQVPKQEMTTHLVQHDPEAMQRVALRVTRLCCSEQGARIDEEYLAKGVETLPQQKDMPWGVIIVILTWILREIGPEVLGSDVYDVLKALVQELRKSVPSTLGSRLPCEPELVRIPAGPFLMGTSDTQIRQLSAHFEWAKDLSFDTEQPQHRIRLPAYQIGRYPISNAQYAAFVQATARDVPRSWPGGRVPGDRAGHPVTDVTWHDAQAYVAWLHQHTGRPYRLATEAEWEKAARGTDARIWPWGNRPPDQNQCNFDRQAGDTTPVGRYSPQGDSPYGCAGMAGNVWEWCQSLYKSYPYQAGDGREDLQADGRRVLRGGSVVGSQRSVRCAYRSWDLPGDWDGNVGFRVVVAPDPSGPGAASDTGA